MNRKSVMRFSKLLVLLVLLAGRLHAESPQFFKNAEDEEHATKQINRIIENVSKPGYNAGIKVGTFTSLAFANTGDVAVTGVGFKPRLIILYNASDNARLVFGACTSPTEDFSGGIFEGTTSSMSGSSCFYYAGGAPTAVLKSMDSDGFTLTFAGTNANFDSETIGYIAFQ